MSLRTFSRFYYGHKVTTENNKINFGEGAAELTATLNSGSYTLTEYLAEIKRALEAAGALTYTVSVARSTRIITIAASGNFELLVSTGSNADVSAFEMIGFSGADRTGAATYAAPGETGSSYTPQFILQDYIGEQDLQRAVEAAVNTTSSGRVEVVKFGSSSFFEMNIRYATDINQGTSIYIRNDSTGVTKLRALMQYLITKAPIEFMPDESTTSTYYKVILESTQEDSRGIGYKLRERYDLGHPGYFDTGILKFRVVE